MSDNARQLSCSDCAVIACRKNLEEKYPKFCLTRNVDKDMLQSTLDIYRDDSRDEGAIHRTSTCLEGEFYCKLTRVEETLLFIERMGYKKIGVATCVGLLRETKVLAQIMAARGIDYYVACCKAGAVDKTAVVADEKKICGGGQHESMCNPIMQAKILADWGSDFNIVVGLCVGHDSLFFKHSAAPCTVLIAKDRVMAHNPAGALYMVGTGYSRFKKDVP